MTPDNPDQQPTRFSKADRQRPPGEEPTLRASGGPPPAAGARSPDPLLGRMFGGCQLEQLLGRGAMGAVYRARQVKLDRDVAVKVIRPEMMTDPRMLKRFEAEARIVGRFQSAHVVMVHDVGFERGVHFLVMELVSGQNLRDHAKLLAGGRLPVGDALPLLRHAIAGLEEAKRLDVVHRDIKPDNLMLTERGVLKIADFGIAKPLQEDFSLTLSSELVGTPLYMSPEQCQGEAEIDFRSDMYSLGATFYYLLTGEPPIRASSVYELIQTKTKLQSLCLWKALPGLGENHPLSRVIERMTALAPADRYPSYEALLNDLLLVEQGATITLPKRASEGAGAVGRNRRTVLFLGTASLAAVGGLLLAWWMRAAAEVPPAGGGAAQSSNLGTAAASTVAGVARLGALRSELQQSGPTRGLLAELRALELPAEQREGRDRLVADAVAALTLAEQLRALSAPTAVELPFDDVRAHLQAVEAAAAAAPAVGPELRAYVAAQVQAARAEDRLTPAVAGRLAGAFARWQQARSAAGADTTALAQLGQQLDTIEAGRSAAMDLLPLARELVQRDLPRAALDTARRDLAAPDRAAVVDVAPALAEVRAEFTARGPEAALVERVRALNPTNVDQLAVRSDLLNELQRAEAASNLALGLRASDFPVAVVPPFRDVGEYFRKLDLALQPVLQVPGGPAPWVQQLRTRLRDEAELGPRVVAACKQALAQLPAGNAAALADLEQALAAARSLLPATAEALAAAIPEAALRAARTRNDEVAAQQQLLAELSARQQELDAIRRWPEWLAAAPALSAAVASLHQRLEVRGAGVSDAVRSAQQRLQAGCSAWQAATQTLEQVLAKVAAGQLGAADNAAQAAALTIVGREELALVQQAVLAGRSAKTKLEQLDLAGAAADLLATATKLQALGAPAAAAATKVAGWQQAVGALQAAAVGMVPIPGGRTKADPTAVPGFFLAAAECSRAEFAAFLAELRQATAGADERAARLAKVEGRFPGLGLTPDRLQAILDLDVSRNADNTPMDNLSWHAAAAFAAWRGRELPTAAEWALAAFGDGNRFEFPWGNGFSNEPDKRNPSNQKLAAVDSGGLSWRLADGVRLHHLAGNVGEWLAADAAAREAPVAGGRFNEGSDTSVREQAAGRLVSADKSDARRGVGLRTVLRPRSAPNLDWQ